MYYFPTQLCSILQSIRCHASTACKDSIVYTTMLTPNYLSLWLPFPHGLSHPIIIQDMTNVLLSFWCAVSRSLSYFHMSLYLTTSGDICKHYDTTLSIGQIIMASCRLCICLTFCEWQNKDVAPIQYSLDVTVK